MTAATITARNVNDALADALWLLKLSGVKSESRNGPVLRLPGPVIIEYEQPTERVLFSAVRDANPFFHLYECIWMMAGAHDAKRITQYAKHMATFAEDTGVLNGAYGYRWRHQFGYDQLPQLITLLKEEPNTRRAVLGMWDPRVDLVDSTPSACTEIKVSKDVPCNTHVYFEIKDNRLDMTVCNRSNDAVWGAFGANVVHMSFLQEFVALSLRVKVGRYYQFTNNLHIYTERDDVKRLLTPDGVVACVEDDRYGTLTQYPIMGGDDWYGFLRDCVTFLDNPYTNKPTFGERFFHEVCVPMMRAHSCYKEGDLAAALLELDNCAAEDWQLAGREWIQRRIERRAAQ